MFIITFPISGELQVKGSAHIGERSIEIPITKLLLRYWEGRKIIEVGAVTPHWLPGQYSHPVYDLYDDTGLAIQKDAEELDFTGLSVLSISTVEHLGLQDYSQPPHPPLDTLKAQRTLNKIIQQAADFFISIPTGYNPPLDAFIMSISPMLHVTSFSQSSPENTWVESSFPDSVARYNSPFPYANTVWFLQKP